MKKPLFTICIPVYKSEKYIGFAIDDMRHQTFEDFECIVIDDKSPDSAIKIAEEMTKGDSRFRILRNEKNVGVSATRNRGLQEAKGEYIIFLDSDDRYDVRLLERVSKQIECTDEPVDIVTWEFGGVGANEEKIKQLELWRHNELDKNKKPVGGYKPEDVADRFFQVNLNSMCMKAFRVAHLVNEKAEFNTNIKFGEDALFSYKAMISASQLVAVPGDNILYYYRRDQEDSAMHTVNFSNQLRNQLLVIVELQDFLKSLGVYDAYRASFERWVSDSVGSIAVRMNDVRIEKHAVIDQEVRAVTESRAWRLVRSIRK